jgi:hypothetical protein
MLKNKWTTLLENVIQQQTTLIQLFPNSFINHVTDILLQKSPAFTEQGEAKYRTS